MGNDHLFVLLILWEQANQMFLKHFGGIEFILTTDLNIQKQLTDVLIQIIALKIYFLQLNSYGKITKKLCQFYAGFKYSLE